MNERLIDGYDVAFFDLDGVIYLGPVAVEGAPQAVAEISAAARVMFVTNNAARSAEDVAAHLRRLGFHAGVEDIITSAQVAAGLLARRLPAGAKVLVVGSENLRSLMLAAGFDVVASADDDPVAVVQGYDPQLYWPRLDEAAIAVQRGATWFATNDDMTRPTDRGLVPGLGTALAVVGSTVPGEPEVFGKPHAPMFDYALATTGARHPIFVGDRLDTDIEGANRAGIDSLLVFTGAHGKRDLVAATQRYRPTAIGADLSALLRPVRSATLEPGTARCGAMVARVRQGGIELTEPPRDVEEQYDALWAVAQLAWAVPSLETAAVLDQLDSIP